MSGRDRGEGGLAVATIAAVATPVGVGGVGIVRLSGPRAAEIVAALLGRRAETLADRTLVHGVVRDATGARVDDVLAVVMRGPRSFTGEDVAEIHGHGGGVNMGRLLRAVIDAGARHAEPGEFTRRAFEHDKIDLTRAEAIADVIEAGSERAWRVAQAQLAGQLGAAVRALRQRATDLLAEVEACIDFPEEDLAFATDAAVGTRAAALAREVERLASSHSAGRALRDGIDVALVGPVNVGKSSLFNALVGSERAIVAAEPGTTRDFVEAKVVWRGIPITLIDTAGERQTGNAIEEKGIELGRRRAETADVRLLVRSAAALADGAGAHGQGHALEVISKADLLDPSSPPPPGALLTSTVTNRGIEELLDAIVERVCGAAADADDGLVVTSERQRTLLDQAANALARGAAGVAAQAPLEMVCLDIREATQSLASILGEQVGDEVLDALFSRFCIGK